MNTYTSLICRRWYQILHGAPTTILEFERFYRLAQRFHFARGDGD